MSEDVIEPAQIRRSARSPRLVRLVRKPAVGAVAGQLSQAAASFLLQVVAARLLGAEGLGVFALLLGVVLTATGVSTGLVGDSLTVLDRRDRHTWSGLVVVGLGSALLGGLVGGLAAAVTGLLSPISATIFGIALVAFLLEDTARRLLMASMRFWSLVVVDVSAAVGYLAVLVGLSLTGTLTLFDVLLAMAVGQVIGLVVGLLLLPSDERRLRWARPADWRHVLSFGGWRAFQQSLSSGMMLGARIIVVVGASAAVYGQLEAARILTAPALLVVQGLGGYLLASFSSASGQRSLLPRADLAAVSLAFASLAVGVFAWAFLPQIASIITAGRFEISGWAVLSWSVFAASSAFTIPYTLLAAVYGKQRRVAILRGVGACVSLVAVYLLLVHFEWPAEAVPVGLSVGTVLLAVIVRRSVLKPSNETAGRAG